MSIAPAVDRVPSRSPRWALRIAVAGALLVALAAAPLVLPVRGLFGDVLRIVEDAGPLGPPALMLVYVVACVLLVPGSVVTLGAGFLFGFPMGLLTASLGSTLGASAAFLLGRGFLRERVEARVRGSGRFEAIHAAVGDQGFQIVVLLRLVPLLPFNILNYAFGLTRISFRTYVLASWVGMLPGAILYVYVGTAARSVADLLAGNVEMGKGGIALFAVGAAAAVGATAVMTRTARRALARAVPGAAPPSSDRRT